MRHIPELLVRQGLTFTNAYASIGLCCPSRVSVLTGQYAHNHRIWFNEPPEGGAAAFHGSGQEAATLAVWLRQAGYRTMLAGKYLNKYDGTFIPPGWDEWYVPVPGNTQFNYELLANGAWEWHGSDADDYEADVLRDKAIDFVRRSAGRPFFAYINPVAPHIPTLAAPRHGAEFRRLPFPRKPSFDEDDLSDKPGWVQRFPRLSAEDERRIEKHYVERVRSLLAVDEMIQALLDVLAQTGQLANTYVAVSSDNGFFLGEHRLTQGKVLPYEEAIHVPLVVRGPDVPAGQGREHLVSLVDLAPTFLELAGAAIPDSVDGRSLAALLRQGPPALDQWRPAVLTEYRDDGTVPTFWSIRTSRYVYTEYESGERELYDMKSDRYQLESRHPLAPPEVLAPLAREVARLKTCRGAACR